MTKRFLLAAAVALYTVALMAQQSQEEKFSRTPFAFEDFRDANIKFAFGRKGTAKANIFLRDASLIFLKDSVKMKADLMSVVEVAFGDTVYRKTGDRLGRMIAEKDGRYLVEVTTIDIEAMREAERRNENTGFLDLPEFNLFIETNAEYFGNTKEPKFPLKSTYYFIKDGQPFKAAEHEFKKHLRSDKKHDFKELMKDRYWSWKDAKSLTVLLDYL